jgi:hypothetical protein
MCAELFEALQLFQCFGPTEPKALRSHLLAWLQLLDLYLFCRYGPYRLAERAPDHDKNPKTAPLRIKA